MIKCHSETITVKFQNDIEPLRRRYTVNCLCVPKII